jgi:hypothetical protein
MVISSLINRRRKIRQSLIGKTSNESVPTRVRAYFAEVPSYSRALLHTPGLIPEVAAEGNLANIYLHEVLDLWFERDVRPRMHGGAFMVRYADDVVMCFAREDDARRVLEVLPKRLGRYGLSLHPEKTRMVEFRRPPHKDNRPSEQRPPRPGTFDFLGFTRYWGRSRKGRWVVKG